MHAHHWLEKDSRFIKTQGHPMTVVDLCLQRDINGHRLLRGTGLFVEDIIHSNPLISPTQFLQLLENSEQLLQGDDASFLLGQRLLPGGLGGVSQALSLAENLQSMLELLCRFSTLLSPLITPRLYVDSHYGYLFWLDNCGAGKMHRFLVETLTVAVVAFSRRQYGQRLPWQLSFNHPQPRHIEQYWVHLGENLQFSQPYNLMRIPRDLLTQSWQTLSTTAFRVAQDQARQQLGALPAERLLLDQLFDHLIVCLDDPESSRHVNLENVACHYAMSPATLKRRLKKHGTHFQQQLDQARLFYSLYLLNCQGLSSEAVAAKLHFHDNACFRRSFKRWTGLTPAGLLARMAETY